MTAHRLLRPRWLATAGAVLLAGILGVAILLQNGGGACAAPPTSAKQKGKATFYDLAGTVGNCNFKPPADDLYVALGRTEYSAALSCGSYLDVTGPRGKVRVKVFDSCPECTPGWLDLSRTAFAKIADPAQGIVPITYRAVPGASTPGPLSITFAEGSSQYWWAVLIDNHANPISSVRAKGPGTGWLTAERTDYNFWLIDRQTGNGPFQVELTDLYGNRVTAKNVKLDPEQKQATSVRFAGSSIAAPAPALAPAKPVTPKKAKPTATPTASPSTSPPTPPAGEAAPVATTELPAPDADLALAAAKPSC
ncbi:expansin EXLX1 family cellulose-binding protein [Actinoplanes sp. NPDC051859]|uniref:expansin EXLX1 family cellulose-binding protein n=1 Tax=Actinoplanes sp. NPDC051859 TaxID=3363909 RepID=UPI0037A4CF66